MSLSFDELAIKEYKHLTKTMVLFPDKDTKIAMYTMGIPASGKSTSAIKIVE